MVLRGRPPDANPPSDTQSSYNSQLRLKPHYGGIILLLILAFVWLYPIQAMLETHSTGVVFSNTGASPIGYRIRHESWSRNLLHHDRLNFLSHTHKKRQAGKPK